MPGLKPPAIVLSEKERQELETIAHRHSTPQQIALRSRIILAAADGLNNREIARQEGCSRDMSRDWRERWLATADREGTVWERLQDAPRSGRPPTFTAEQLCDLFALACEDPQDSGCPITRWTPQELAEELVKRQIVASISPRHVGRLLQEADLKPHQIRYWMMSQPDAQWDYKVADITTLYRHAREWAQQGIRVLCTDEKTGIQALERKHPGLPLQPGEGICLEFEYVRFHPQNRSHAGKRVNHKPYKRSVSKPYDMGGINGMKDLFGIVSG